MAQVLFVDDNIDLHRVMQALLRFAGHEGVCLPSGEAALEYLKTTRPDVLLLDLMMPHDGGLTVLRNLREHQPSLLGRVIVLTGSGRAATDPWSELVFAIVHKPFDPAALVETVQACVRQRRGKRVVEAKIA